MVMQKWPLLCEQIIKDAGGEAQLAEKLGWGIQPDQWGSLRLKLVESIDPEVQEWHAHISNQVVWIVAPYQSLQQPALEKL